MQVNDRKFFAVNLHELRVLRIEMNSSLFRTLKSQFEELVNQQCSERKFDAEAIIFRTAVRKIAEVANECVSRAQNSCEINLSEFIETEAFAPIFKDQNVDVKIFKNPEVAQRFEKMLRYVFVDLIKPGQCTYSADAGKLKISWIKGDVFKPKVSAVVAVTFAEPTRHTLLDKDNFLLKNHLLPEYEGFVQKGSSDNVSLIPLVCESEQSLENILKGYMNEPGVERVQCTKPIKIDLVRSSSSAQPSEPVNAASMNKYAEWLIARHIRSFALNLAQQIVPPTVNQMETEHGKLPAEKKIALIKKYQELFISKLNSYFMLNCKADLIKELAESKISEKEISDLIEKDNPNATLKSSDKLMLCMTYALPIGKIVKLLQETATNTSIYQEIGLALGTEFIASKF